MDKAVEEFLMKRRRKRWERLAKVTNWTADQYELQWLFNKNCKDLIESRIERELMHLEYNLRHKKSA